jgi:hypothetical protein
VVAIKRRLSRYGVDLDVIEQLDGSLAQLPAWMLREAAALLGLRPEPRFPLEVLRSLRAEVDALLGFRDRASHRLDHAAELDESSVASALEHPPVLAGDGGIDEFRAQCPQPRERAVLVRARHPAEANDVGSQDRSDLVNRRAKLTPDWSGPLGADREVFRN